MLIANEAIDSILKNNENGILCKLDIEKAYDNVDWSFLFIVMQKMGFGERWLGWIKWCISTASFSVLINGTPKGFFQSSRGLRQGDPLSPYLFVIAMEVFSSFLKRAVDNGYISGCEVKGRNEGGIQISHLLFADDTLVFCQASQHQLTYLSWLLMWFEAVSGMRINLDKSELIPVGRVVDIDDLAFDFGCKVGSLPSTYLGLPLGAPFKSVAVWDGVEKRFRKRLSMWKRQYLSKGGRATLIRSTLSNLPIYSMSVLRLPSSIRRRLEQIQRDFLWGGGSLERKPHLVRWKVVCLSKKKGGLGIKCLSILNKRGLVHSGSERAYGVGLWKGIRMDWDLVGARTSFSVGNGRRVRFWRDRWCGDALLCESFPSLFALSIEKEAWVADVWDPLVQGGRGGWNPCFSRALNDWEVEEAELFLGCLHGKRVLGDVDDKVVWTETKSGIFSAKSLYLALEADCPISFPSSCIWKVWVQPKISFFCVGGRMG
ncbi:putative ribonuclease H protein [Vitis vinifera]|uniref:Putative ribonuclease H protein n=1 Tax=Vitis vinifera TaxID=29760 RepID=A0A438KLJ1_VITVI|nr:putative ribonuclease H protein [Vitis vinifera]